MEGGAKRAGENKAGRGRGGERSHPEGETSRRRRSCGACPGAEAKARAGPGAARRLTWLEQEGKGEQPGWGCRVVLGQEREGADRPERQPKPPEASLVGHLACPASFFQWGQHPAPHPFLLLPDPCGSARLTQDLPGHSGRWGRTGTQPGY